MKTTDFAKHPEIQQKFEELRKALASKGFAFGSMFVGFREHGKSQGMIVLADKMPPDLQRSMLLDLQDGIVEMLKYWRVH